MNEKLYCLKENPESIKNMKEVKVKKKTVANVKAYRKFGGSMTHFHYVSLMNTSNY